MKMKREHLVPLSTQVVALLRELHKLTSKEAFVFAGLKDGKPLSENTLNGALRRLDFDTRAEHCAHGFRTSASTMIREQLKPKVQSDAIEAQLAHKKPGVRGVYDRAEHLEERVMMMQRWSGSLPRHAPRLTPSGIPIRVRAGVAPRLWQVDAAGYPQRYPRREDQHASSRWVF